MGTKRKITGDIFDLGIQLDHPTEQAGRVLLYTLADKLYQRFPNGDIKAVGSGEGSGSGGIGWATTGKLDDFDAAASTAGVVVTGDDTKATMSATEAGQVFAFKAVDIPMVLDQNYFRGLSLATAAFDAKIQCFSTEWVDVGGLVEPINTSEVDLFLLSFSKKEYTKARVVFTSLAAGTLTISRGEWTDQFSKIVEVSDESVIIERSGNNGEAIAAGVTNIPFGTTAGGDKITSFVVPFDGATFSAVGAVGATTTGFRLSLFKNGVRFLDCSSYEATVGVAAFSVITRECKRGDIMSIRSLHNKTLNVSAVEHHITFTATPIGKQRGYTATADLDGRIGELLITSNGTAPSGYASTMNKSFGKTGADYSGDSYKKLYEYMWALPMLNVSVSARKGYRLNNATKGATALADWDAGKLIFVDLDDEHIRISATKAGSHVDDAMQGHKHQSGLYGPRPANGTVNEFATTSSSYPAATTGNPISDGTNGTPRTADETRVKATYHYAYIRYDTVVQNMIAPIAVQYPTETKILASDVTATGDIASLTFTGLEIGAEYEVTGQVKRSGYISTDTGVVFRSGAGNTGAIYGSATSNTDSSTISSGVSAGVSFRFVADSANMYAYKFGMEHAVSGNGTRELTFLQLTRRNSTGMIASSTDAVHKYAVRASATEHEVGFCEFTGKTIYERWIYFPSNVTTSNAGLVNIGTGVTPVGVANHIGTQWILSASSMFTSTSYLSVYFDKATGNLGVDMAGYKVGAGTRIPFRYTKD